MTCPDPGAHHPQTEWEDLADWSAYPDKACLPEEILVDLSDLARFLGGDGTSFTGDLLRLLAKADPPNLNRLAAGYPRHVAAWLMWRTMSSAAPLTAARLIELLTLAHTHRRPVQ